MAEHEQRFPTLNQGSSLHEIHAFKSKAIDEIYHGNASPEYLDHLHALEDEALKDDNIEHQLERIYTEHVKPKLKQNLADKLGHFENGVLAAGHKRTNLNSHVKVPGDDGERSVYVKDAAYEAIIDTGLNVLKGHFEGDEKMRPILSKLEKDLGDDDKAEHARERILRMVDHAYHGQLNLYALANAVKDPEGQAGQQIFRDNPMTLGTVYQAIDESFREANQGWVPGMFNRIHGTLNTVYDDLHPERESLSVRIADATKGLKAADPNVLALKGPTAAAHQHRSQWRKHLPPEENDLVRSGYAPAGDNSYEANVHGH